MTDDHYPMLDVVALVRLSEIADAALNHKKVSWWVDLDHDPITGVARAITDASGNFWWEDVRDGYLWISATTEWFLPITDVLDLSVRGMFVIE